MNAEAPPDAVPSAQQYGDATNDTQLRQRKSGFALDSDRSNSVPTPPLNRRSSSFITTSSLGSARVSTDDLFAPRATGQHDEFSQEITAWHSLPLLFALLPAVGGAFSKSISGFVSDLVLLCLAGIYLNWCLVTPWTWYHAAQAVKLAGIPTQQDFFEEKAIEEEEEDGTSQINGPNGDTRQEKTSPSTDAALSELRMHEVTALILCILGPLLGSYLLHVVRSQLTQFGDMVSDLHLTLFILVAEIRPLRHLMKMLHARTIHLQRFVREDPYAAKNVTERIDPDQISDLQTRLEELEANVSSSVQKAISTPAPIEQLEPLRKGQAALQSQIDALNRAVRRYEKRATAQTIQTESRLQDLESRLKDALSLAAAAVNSSQKQGSFAVILHWISQVFVLPLRALSASIIYPLRLAGRALAGLMVRLGLARIETRQAPPTKPGVRSRAVREGPVARQKKSAP